MKFGSLLKRNENRISPELGWAGLEVVKQETRKWSFR